MLLYVIRHGEPDYKRDCLTEKGKLQAKAVAERLLIGGIDEIHASPLGRARETAEPLAEALSLPILTQPWAREFSEETYTTFSDGKRKELVKVPTAYYHAPEHRTLTEEEALDTLVPFQNNEVKAHYAELKAGLDAFLAAEGYARNGRGFYDAVAPNDRHVALFCHAAMLRALCAYLLHVPYQMFVSTLVAHHTGVTVFEFASDNAEVSPRLISFGDVGHLYFADPVKSFAPPAHSYLIKKF